MLRQLGIDYEHAIILIYIEVQSYECNSRLLETTSEKAYDATRNQSQHAFRKGLHRGWQIISASDLQILASQACSGEGGDEDETYDVICVLHVCATLYERQITRYRDFGAEAPAGIIASFLVRIRMCLPLKLLYLAVPSSRRQ